MGLTFQAMVNAPGTWIDHGMRPVTVVAGRQV
jgi:hypothetical protein